MSKVVRFFGRYLMIPLFGPVIAGVAAGVYMSQEIDGNQYGSYTTSWNKANPQTQNAVREAMEDGVITRWESSDLNRIILDDVRFIALCSGDCDKNKRDSSKNDLVALLKKS